MGQQPQTQPYTKSYIAKGIIACLGGLALHCVVGSLYQWGMINLYVTSYYKTLQPELTLQSNAIAFPLMMFCYGLTMRLGIYLTEIIHPLIVLSCITVMFSAAVFVSSLMSSMWGFLALYDILFGLLIGMVFMIPVVQCNKYFPGKKLFVNGIVFAGTGFGAAIFGSFSYNFLNPHKLKPIDGYYLGSPEVQQLAMQVPKLIKYLALFYLCLGLVGILMMAPVIVHNRRVEGERREKERIKREERVQRGLVVGEDERQQTITRPNEANSVWQVITSWACWRQCLIIILFTTGLYLIQGNYKTYVRKTLHDDDFLTLIGVAGSIVNGSSRFLWSLIFSKTGYKTVALGIVTISIIVLSLIRLTIHSKGGYMFMFMLTNFGVGGIQVSNPSLVQYMFGQRMGQNCYGFFWCSVAVANFVEFVFVSQLGLVLEFDYLLYICLAMTVAVIPVIVLSRFQGPWLNSTQYLEYCVTCYPTTTDQSTVVVEIQPSESLKNISPNKESDITLGSPEKIHHHQNQQQKVQDYDYADDKMNKLSTCDELPPAENNNDDDRVIVMMMNSQNNSQQQVESIEDGTHKQAEPTMKS